MSRSQEQSLRKETDKTPTEEKPTAQFPFSGVGVLRQTYPDASAALLFQPQPVQEIKDVCVVVLDTNVLLLPYNTGKDSLQQIQSTFSTLIEQKRLVVPAQVAREFVKNRPDKIKDVHQQIALKNDIVLPTLKQGLYPLLAEVAEHQELLKLEQDIKKQIEQLDSLFKIYRKGVGKLLERIRGWTGDDPVSQIYSHLFAPEGIVREEAISEAELKKDLERRNQFRIPPGFQDGDKSFNAEGDLAIWHTILEVGQEKKSVIFVSGDEKNDWRYRSNHQALGARQELVDEFRRRSQGQSFHIVSFANFLELFGATQEVVQEVRQEEVLTVASHRDLEAPDASASLRARGMHAERAVRDWLHTNYMHTVADDVAESGGFATDMILTNIDGTRTAIVTAYYSNPDSLTPRRLRALDRQLEGEIDELGCDDMIFVAVTEGSKAAIEVQRRLLEVMGSSSKGPEGRRVTLIYGCLTGDNSFRFVASHPLEQHTRPLRD